MNLKSFFNHLSLHREWYLLLPLAGVVPLLTLWLVLFLTGRHPVDDAGDLWAMSKNFFGLCLAVALTGFSKGHLIADFPNESNIPWQLHLIETLGTLCLLVFYSAILFSLLPF